MYEAVGQALGSGLGGGLGLIGGALSAPRRALWAALGAPENGNELVANSTGLDKDGFLARALGLGAEVIGDPLTYAGGVLGGPLGKLWGRAAGAEAALAGDIGTMTAAKAAAQKGLADRAALEAATVQQNMARVPGFAGLDIAGIAGDQAKRAAYAGQSAFDELAAAGLGRAANTLPPPAVSPHLPLGVVNDVETLGRTFPPGFGSVPLRGTNGGKMIGSSLQRTSAGTLPTLSPEELDFMRRMAATEPGGWQGLEQATAGGLGPRQLVEETMRHSAARANAARPMPKFSEVLGQGPFPSPIAGAMSQPLPQALTTVEQAIAEALARQKAMEFGLSDYLKVGGAAYGGGLAGDYLQRQEGRSVR